MTVLAFHKVAALPGTLDADSFYFVEAGTYAESYLTDSTGAARSIGNSDMITAVAGTAITAALATLNTLSIVADITARDELATLDRNFLVLVLDASADVTVTSGAAMYAFQNSDNTWHKVTEYESLDVVVAWANITDKPSSSVADIDDAVTKKHAHTNIAVLDLLTDSGGSLLYDGNPVGSAQWDTNNW